MEVITMSTITLKSNVAVNRKNSKSWKGRLAEYFANNQDVITLGCYVVSGRIPDQYMLRAMKMI